MDHCCLDRRGDNSQRRQQSKTRSESRCQIKAILCLRNRHHISVQGGRHIDLFAGFLEVLSSTGISFSACLRTAMSYPSSRMRGSNPRQQDIRDECADDGHVDNKTRIPPARYMSCDISRRANCIGPVVCRLSTTTDMRRDGRNTVRQRPPTVAKERIQCDAHRIFQINLPSLNPFARAIFFHKGLFTSSSRLARVVRELAGRVLNRHDQAR